MPKSAEPSMDDLLKDISKEFSLTIGNAEESIEPVTGLSTGNVAADYLTGVGGIPLGRITELAGQSSSGKSTLALQTAALEQRRIIESGADQHILYLDHEHALDIDYAGELGIDLSHRSFLLAQPSWLEQGAEAAKKLIRTGKIRLVIFDSVAAMTPKDLIEGSFEQRTNAMNRARLMSSFLQQLIGLIHEHGTAAIFINHLMEAVEMGGRPGMPPKTTTPGGKALKYYASVRMEFRQVKNVKGAVDDVLGVGDANLPVATLVQMKVTKNKVGPPFRQATVRSRFGRGFDSTWSALQILVASKTVPRTSAGQFGFPGELEHEEIKPNANGLRQIHGEGRVLAFADAHPEWAERLSAAAQKVLADGQVTTDIEIEEEAAE